MSKVVVYANKGKLGYLGKITVQTDNGKINLWSEESLIARPTYQDALKDARKMKKDLLAISQ